MSGSVCFSSVPKVHMQVWEGWLRASRMSSLESGAFGLKPSFRFYVNELFSLLQLFLDKVMEAIAVIKRSQLTYEIKRRAL